MAQRSITLPIGGMSCAACQGHVQRALEQVPGVATASVSLLTNEATVTLVETGGVEAVQSTVQDTVKATVQEMVPRLIAAVREQGYEAADPTTSSPEEAARLAATGDSYPILLRKGLLALAVGAVLMGVMLFGGTSHDNSVWRWSQMALTIGIMAGPGREYYRKSLAGLRHGNTDMSTLILLGTGSAFLFSAFATVAPHWFHQRGLMPEVYFEAVIFILALVLLGRAMEARAKQETGAALRQMAELVPPVATVRRGESWTTASVAVLLPGDWILAKPGERFAVDGVVRQGEGAVDESMLTGEPLPVKKGPGSAVVSGTLNGNVALTYEATAVGEATTVARMVAITRQAQANRAPMQRLADRVSAWFVPAVVLAAALTFGGWMVATGDVARALANAVSVLIIACPCAMGLAVPAAVMVATGRAARLGILIKGGEPLEKLAKLQTVVFDKTGTLTKGQPRAERVYGTVAALRLAGALEQASEHPLAKAVVAAAMQEQERALPTPESAEAVVGEGIRGVVEGHAVMVGRPSWVLANLPLGRAAAGQEAGQEADEEATKTATVAAGIDGELALLLRLEDPVKADAAGSIQRLQQLGLQLWMLTGDEAARAAAVAKATGITNFAANLRPEEKLAKVQALREASLREGRESGAVAMVGDGINDAPALAAADVGMAFASGANIAASACEVTLLRNDLGAAADAIALGRAATRVMRQNLFWAFLYNAVSIPLAAMGYLHPVLASAAMALSSVSVLLNSLRLKRA